MLKNIIITILLTLGLVGCTPYRDNIPRAVISDEKTVPPKEREIVKIEGIKNYESIYLNFASEIEVYSCYELKNTSDKPYKINPKLSYKDTNNNFVGEASLVYCSPSIVMPNSSGYVTVKTSNLILNNIKDFKGSELSFETVEANPIVRYVVNDFKEKLEPNAPSLSKGIGTVKNISFDTVRNIEVVGLLYDENNKVIGTPTTTLLNNLASGESSNFQLSYLEIAKEVLTKVKHTKVYAYLLN